MSIVKILVCCHKPDYFKSDDVYMPIHVGKAISKYELGIQDDVTGDNISKENPSFCELTGMYWAWKNLKNVDVIGLCHYRRYFDFNNHVNSTFNLVQIHQSKFEKMNMNVDDKILKKVLGGNIVVARKETFPNSNFEMYSIYHSSIDMRFLEHVVQEKCETKYRDAFEKVMHHSNKLSPFNMFLMRWYDFDAYCSWLFPLLFEVKKSINIMNYDSYQTRIFGYMAERLFNVWLVANSKIVIPKSVIQVQPNNAKCSNKFKTLYNNYICNLSYKISLLSYDSIKSNLLTK